MENRSYLLDHVLGDALAGIHGEHGPADLLIGQLELREEDGAVLGAPAIDDGQLLGLLGT